MNCLEMFSKIQMRQKKVYFTTFASQMQFEF